MRPLGPAVRRLRAGFARPGIAQRCHNPKLKPQDACCHPAAFPLNASGAPSWPVVLVLLLGCALVNLRAHAQGPLVATGSLTEARSWATATLLADGKVLITGGNQPAVASAELYDPATGTFSATGDMHVARAFHTATLLANGKVLIAGGSSDRSAELYDAATGTLTPTGSTAEVRFGHTATLLQNGKVLIAGGSTGDFDLTPQLSTAEIYDPATGTFTATGAMTAVRTLAAATLLANGKVLITGGYFSCLDNEGFPKLCPDSSAELFDPATGSFAATGPMEEARAAHAITSLPDGTVLVAGGVGPLANAELYDSSAGTFSFTTGAMLTGREFATATLLTNGTVLLAGGFTQEGDPKLAELYDPAAGTFSPAGLMSTGRVGHTATPLQNGDVLLAGGDAQNAGTAELYRSSNTEQLLLVSKTGNGSGTVTSSPAGIDCGATCSKYFASGSVITLTAAPSGDSRFVGWTGDCSGAGPCTVTMDRGHSIPARFQSTFALTVRLQGEGGGSVSSVPAGITCDFFGDAQYCSASYAVGTVVVLTATAPHTSLFLGWSGACSGSSASCTVTMNSDLQVDGSFEFAPTFTLQVSRAGLGTGAITSNFGNIAFDGIYTFVVGDTVNLAANPATGSTFNGWSGACSGTGSCTITGVANASYTVAADFSRLPNPPQFTLNFTRQGDGSGQISSSPAGLSCGTACSAQFTQGTQVTLTATPASGSVFSGWGGACTGLGVCSISLNSTASVTATFSLAIFQFDSATTATQTIVAGQPARFQLVMSGPLGFNATVSFACTSSLPTGAACSFDPTTLALGPTSTASTLLTITTTARTTASLRLLRGLNFAALFLPLALVVTCGKSHRTKGWLALFCLVASISMTIACGGGSPVITFTSGSIPTGNAAVGTPAGTYTISVTARSGDITRTKNVILLVN